MQDFFLQLSNGLRQGIPEEIYELIAQGARYWFLFLMALIVWRSYRWYRKDKRSWRKRLKELPDAGLVGEFVVEEGAGVLENGTLFSVPREGTLGRGSTGDICLKDPAMKKNLLWFRYENGKGLLVQAFGKETFRVDGREIPPKSGEIYLGHGSLLEVGIFALRLRMFEGFSCANKYQPPAPPPEEMVFEEEFLPPWEGGGGL